MDIPFIVFLFFLLQIRLNEMLLANRNGRWLLEQGAQEYGKNHYPYMLLMHSLFFVSLLTEYVLKHRPHGNYLFLAILLVVIALKIWTVSSLGRYWNTRIYRIPGTRLVKRGPYKYLRHPNYLIVTAEIALIPMVFQLYYTCVIFTILNGIMLSIRIKVENAAWKDGQIPLAKTEK